MLLRLTGVLQDGTNPNLNFPILPSRNPAKTLQVPFGADVTIELTVVKADGTPVDVSLNAVALTFTLKKSSDQCTVTPGLILTGVKATAPIRKNVAIFTILSADWFDTQLVGCITAGRWVYDVWMDVLGVRDNLIPLSAFVISPAATLP